MPQKETKPPPCPQISKYPHTGDPDEPHAACPVPHTRSATERDATDLLSPKPLLSGRLERASNTLEFMVESMTTATSVPNILPSPVPPPRWARIAAHAAALTPLPSALWRFSIVFGFSGGFTAQGLINLDVAGSGWIYLVALSVVTELAALLTLGLIQPWGEVLPRWVPFLGGRPIHPKPVIIVASLGASLLIVLWTPLLLWWNTPHPDMTAAGANIVGLLYLPLVAWGPLLAAVTISYAKRHRTPAKGVSSS